MLCLKLKVQTAQKIQLYYKDVIVISRSYMTATRS